MRTFSSEESGRPRPGDHATQSGIYRVHHRAHRLPHSVYISAGSRLPLCQRCGSDVEFSLLMAGPDLDSDFDFLPRTQEALSA